ncbi:MAG: tRNA-intron lyase [Thermoplasmatales archaeon]|nr:tRNA-intron lyase [Thermoplasmatales archaeon]
MQTAGEIIGNNIIVKKPKDVGRLFTKSHFGKPLSGGSLELDLIEGVFLLEEEKIKIKKGKKEIDFEALISLASKKIPHFEIKYLVFKDLRKRGHAIHLFEKDKIITFNQIKNKFYVIAFSERDELDLKKMKTTIKSITKNGKALWIAIVDEEGDITYYDASLLDIKGKIKKHKFPKGRCVMLDNRSIVFDKKLARVLFEKEFFGKPFGEWLQISFVETLYLNKKGIVEITTSGSKKISKQKVKEIISKKQSDINQRLVVFEDLKKRGLIVKTGFKFGSHFRAYTKGPDETHAEYLIHVVSSDFKSIWEEISRAVRLAHSVNKEICLAQVSKSKIDYIKFGRLRP